MVKKYRVGEIVSDVDTGQWYCVGGFDTTSDGVELIKLNDLDGNFYYAYRAESISPVSKETLLEEKDHLKRELVSLDYAIDLLKI